MFYLFIFLSQILLIYFLTRKLTNELYNLLLIFIKKENTIFKIISLIYLPGTVLHEMSHFIMATILLLKVKRVNFFPEFSPGRIKLGSVSYERKDFIRGFIVGIAPLFGAIFFFYFIKLARPFPSDSMYLDLIILYLIFAVSSTMFSSKQDLADFIYIIPTLIIAAILIHILPIDINLFIKNEAMINNMLQFVKEVNFYLFLSLLANGFIIVVLRAIGNLLRK